MTSSRDDESTDAEFEVRSQAALRDAVLDRLTEVEEIAEAGADGTARLPLARSELYRLADGWRLLLTVHGAGQDGRCKACPGWFRRHRRWPCQVWLMAHQHLLGETLPELARQYSRFAPPRWLDPRRRLIHRVDDEPGPLTERPEAV